MEVTLVQSRRSPGERLLAGARASARLCVRWSIPVGALGLDVWSLRLLQEAAPGLPLGFVLLHVAASLLFAAQPVLGRRRPDLPGPVFEQVAARFVAALFLPGVGIAGWIAIGPVAAAERGTVVPPRWRHVVPEALPERLPPGEEEARPLNAANIAGILQFGRDPRERIRALKHLDRLPDRAAIPLLRLALQDPEDDVRLLAFAILDRKQKRMDDRIAQGQALVRSGEGAGADRLLAMQYWEQAYSGLAQADFTAFLLDRAEDHARNALAGNAEDAGLHFLLGRIRLRRKALAEARAALLRAGECGIPEEKLLPYLNEALLCGPDEPGTGGDETVTVEKSVPARRRAGHG